LLLPHRYRLQSGSHGRGDHSFIHLDPDFLCRWVNSLSRALQRAPDLPVHRIANRGQGMYLLPSFGCNKREESAASRVYTLIINTSRGLPNIRRAFHMPIIICPCLLYSAREQQCRTSIDSLIFPLHAKQFTVVLYGASCETDCCRSSGALHAKQSETKQPTTQENMRQHHKAVVYTTSQRTFSGKI
jgi:hypothetical protein